MKDMSNSGGNQSHQQQGAGRQTHRSSSAGAGSSRRSSSTLRLHQPMPRSTNTLMDGGPQKSPRQGSSSSNKLKKVSYNHLLNFSFPERQSRQDIAVRRKKTESLPVYNKERYINANFRFVLDSRGSYGGNLIDPDVFANWDNIVQVMVNNTKPQACPICLSVPVSPKMTKCGHVYCYACILHYLHLGDKKWRKCPICYDSVYSKDLKSVGFTSSMLVEKPSLQHPTTLTMRLMKRSSTIALPKASYDAWKQLDYPPSLDDAEAQVFSKYLLASDDFVLAMFAKEEIELKSHLHETGVEEADSQAVALAIKGLSSPPSSAGPSSVDQQSSEIPFIEMALREVQAKKEKYQQPAERRLGNKDKDGFFYTALPQTGQQSSSSPPTMKSDIGNEPTYFFYVAADGQHYYLHPLDIRILKYEYQEYENFPETLDFIIMSIQDSTMDEELRKRCKYLSHLSLSCDVSFCEVDWNKMNISKDTFKFFSKQINERRSKLKDQERKEKVGSLKKGPTPHDHETDVIPMAGSFHRSHTPVLTDMDFPEVLSKSPESGKHSTSPSHAARGGISFASIAKTNSPFSVNTTPYKARGATRAAYNDDDDYYNDEVDDYHGWTLDLEDFVLDRHETSSSYNGDGALPLKGKKSKGSGKKLLVTNGGPRRRN